MKRILNQQIRYVGSNGRLSVMDGNTAAAHMAYALSEQVCTNTRIARGISSLGFHLPHFALHTDG
jgi:hypothetical protein